MAGALIGLISGAALGYEGHKIKEQHEQKTNFANLILQQSEKNPGLLDLPESQKVLKDVYGKGGVEILQSAAKAHQASQAGFNQIANGQPATQAPQGQPSQPQQPEDIDAHIAKIQAFIDQHPEFAEQGKAHIEELRSQGERQQKQQDFERSAKDREQAHADTEADREAARADREQARADAAAARGDAAAAREQARQWDQDFKKSQQQITEAKNEDDRKAKVEQLGKSLDAGRDKILEDFAKLPDASKPAAQARIDAYNASASMFYKRHADSGAPTLLKFTPAVPGTGLKGAVGLGGTAPTIDAVPPTYGSYKGKSGFLDATGNFYPDAGTP